MNLLSDIRETLKTVAGSRLSDGISECYLNPRVQEPAAIRPYGHRVFQTLLSSEPIPSVILKQVQDDHQLCTVVFCYIEEHKKQVFPIRSERIRKGEKGYCVLCLKSFSHANLANLAKRVSPNKIR